MSPLCARPHSPASPAPQPRRLVAIALFCALLAGGRPALAQQPTAATLRAPGEVALELSDLATSTLGIHPVILNEALCPPLPGGPISGGVGECGITVNNGGPPRTFNLVVNHYTLNTDGTTTATAFSDRLSLVGAKPFESSCGMWSFEVTLDPHAAQPSSAIRLGRPAAGAYTAWFSGTATVAALLRFTEVTSHQVQEIPTTLTLDLAGRWTALAKGGASTTTGSPILTFKPGSLALMVERRAEWASLPTITSGGCQGGFFCGCGHRLAFTAPQALVDTLNLY
jgi:hypothetical protein